MTLRFACHKTARRKRKDKVGTTLNDDVLTCANTRRNIFAYRGIQIINLREQQVISYEKFRIPGELTAFITATVILFFLPEENTPKLLPETSPRLPGERIHKRIPNAWETKYPRDCTVLG